jgi:hypothetical protein
LKTLETISNLRLSDISIISGDSRDDILNEEVIVPKNRKILTPRALDVTAKTKILFENLR